jgi:hypothetical protein
MNSQFYVYDSNNQTRRISAPQNFPESSSSSNSSSSSSNSSSSVSNSSSSSSNSSSSNSSSSNSSSSSTSNSFSFSSIASGSFSSSSKSYSKSSVSSSESSSSKSFSSISSSFSSSVSFSYISSSSSSNSCSSSSSESFDPETSMTWDEDKEQWLFCIEGDYDENGFRIAYTCKNGIRTEYKHVKARLIEGVPPLTGELIPPGSYSDIIWAGIDVYLQTAKKNPVSLSGSDQLTLLQIYAPTVYRQEIYPTELTDGLIYDFELIEGNKTESALEFIDPTYEEYTDEFGEIYGHFFVDLSLFKKLEEEYDQFWIRYAYNYWVKTEAIEHHLSCKYLYPSSGISGYDISTWYDFQRFFTSKSLYYSVYHNIKFGSSSDHIPYRQWERFSLLSVNSEIKDQLKRIFLFVKINNKCFLWDIQDNKFVMGIKNTEGEIIPPGIMTYDYNYGSSLSSSSESSLSSESSRDNRPWIETWINNNSKFYIDISRPSWSDVGGAAPYLEEPEYDEPKETLQRIWATYAFPNVVWKDYDSQELFASDEATNDYGESEINISYSFSGGTLIGTSGNRKLLNIVWINTKHAQSSCDIYSGYDALTSFEGVDYVEKGVRCSGQITTEYSYLENNEGTKTEDYVEIGYSGGYLNHLTENITNYTYIFKTTTPLGNFEDFSLSHEGSLDIKYKEENNDINYDYYLQNNSYEEYHDGQLFTSSMNSDYFNIHVFIRQIVKKTRLVSRDWLTQAQDTTETTYAKTLEILANCDVITTTSGEFDPFASLERNSTFEQALLELIEKAHEDEEFAIDEDELYNLNIHISPHIYGELSSSSSSSSSSSVSSSSSSRSSSSVSNSSSSNSISSSSSSESSISSGSSISSSSSSFSVSSGHSLSSTF